MTRLDPTEIARIYRSLRARPTSGGGARLGEVTRVDADGTAWVHLFGGADETPVGTLLASVRPGDVVQATISGGRATVQGNATSPAASSAAVAETAAATRLAIDGILGEIVEIKKANIDEATVNRLLSLEATVRELQADWANINTVVAGEVDALHLEAEFAGVDFANVDAAQVGTAKIVELLSNSGIFRNLVYDEGHVTGTLVAVEVLGDLIKAGTIAADRIIYQGTDAEGNQTGLWYQLNATGAGGLSPEELTLERYRNALDGSHLVAKSVTANEIYTDSLVADTAFMGALNAALLLAEAVKIGNPQSGIHIEMRGDRFSFFERGYGFDSLPDGYEATAGSPLPGEVAYMAVDPATNESMFYMTRAVVVKNLRFGNWKWYDRPNGNMSLKWIGGL